MSPENGDGPLATRGPTAEMNLLHTATATTTAKTGTGYCDRSPLLLPVAVVESDDPPGWGRRFRLVRARCPRDGAVHAHRLAADAGQAGPVIRRGACGHRYALVSLDLTAVAA